MNNIEQLLPTAIDVVKEKVLKDKKVPREFNGYISSFGASVLSSGLLPTIVFFSQEGKRKGKGDRRSVIDALEKIMHKKYSSILGENEKLISKVKSMTESRQSTDRLKEKLEECAIALKLAIRIFPKSKNK